MSTDKKFSEYSRQSNRQPAFAAYMGGRFEMDIPLISQEALINQVTHCLKSGIPFGHAVACPLNNIIPDLCDCLCKSQWREACDLLHSANNFPEITSRICPAPCAITRTEGADKESFPVRQMEYQIAEYGFANDWIRPARVETKSGKRVVIVGSGPAGLTVAQQLARSGHEVIVLEKDEHVGGLLRYGTPYFKLSQIVLNRRLNQLEEEGVQFVTGITIGQDISYSYLRKMCDAICVAVETGPPRDLSLPGRHLENVILGTEYLRQANLTNASSRADLKRPFSARGKVVAVIGGGDTGYDCVAVALNDGASRAYQLEIRPGKKKSLHREINHEQTDENCRDDCIRCWCVHTKSFSGSDGKVKELHGIEVKWLEEQDGLQMHEIPGTEFTLEVDLVLVAIGFEDVLHDSVIKKFGFRVDSDGNLVSNQKNETSQVGLFATGDIMIGAPLVGRAITSGRKVATQINQYLITHKGRK